MIDLTNPNNVDVQRLAAALAKADAVRCLLPSGEWVFIKRVTEPIWTPLNPEDGDDEDGSINFHVTVPEALVLQVIADSAEQASETIALLVPDA